MVRVNAQWVEEYFNLLLPADPKKLGIDEAQRLKLTHLPISLFRYRPFPPMHGSTVPEDPDSESLRQRTLEEIRTGEVCLSSPDAFNDPYDSVFCMLNQPDWDLAGHPKLPAMLKEGGIAEFLCPEEIRQVLQSQKPLHTLGHLLARKDPSIPEHNVDRFLAFVEEWSSGMMKKVQEDMGSRMREGVRICCFSATVQSAAMWSHYASAHSGLCIEYDFNALPSNHPLRYAVCPVVYVEALFDAGKYFAQAQVGQFNNLWLTLACLHKSAEWSYEQEWRIVLPLGPGQPPREWVTLPIKAVHLGARAPMSTAEVVRRVTRSVRVPLLETSLSKASFILSTQPFARKDELNQ